MPTFSDAFGGVTTALLLPRHLNRIQALTVLGQDRPVPPRQRDAQGSIRVGLFVLRQLSRLRTPLWKNTCLFRSVLRSTLLRRAGHEAVLRIGVAKDPEGNSIAHAWVELAGMPTPDEGLDYTPLTAVARVS